MPKLLEFFEICAEVLVPKFTRAEVLLPGHRSYGHLIHYFAKLTCKTYERLVRSCPTKVNDVSGSHHDMQFTYIDIDITFPWTTRSSHSKLLKRHFQDSLHFYAILNVWMRKDHWSKTTHMHFISIFIQNRLFWGLYMKGII